MCFYFLFEVHLKSVLAKIYQVHDYMLLICIIKKVRS